MIEAEFASQETRDLMSQFLAKEEAEWRAAYERHGTDAPAPLMLNRLLIWWGENPIPA